MIPLTATDLKFPLYIEMIEALIPAHQEDLKTYSEVLSFEEEQDEKFFNLKKILSAGIRKRLL